MVLSINRKGIDRINRINRIGFTLQHLVPILGLRPERLQRRIQVPAKKNIEVFVTPRIGMRGAADRIDPREVLAIARAVAAKHDHAFAGVVARPPKPVALMIADRFRQPIFFPEEIDRARLAGRWGSRRPVAGDEHDQTGGLQAARARAESG